MDYRDEIRDLVDTVLRENASDLHIAVGRYPTIRVNGELVALTKKQLLTPEIAEGLVSALIPAGRKEEFLRKRSIDFSYQHAEQARFRVNSFFYSGFMGAALRLIPVHIRTIEDLGVPQILKEFTLREQGFFLIAGPTGHGKSTTLAALIDLINHTRAEHIVTIEDPIEYMFTQDRSVISQREIGIDAADFSSALRAMFRQDVNVGMIGEMRDPETMSAAVTAAETGHLIFSSLHTNSASQTIDRILDSFPGHQQQQIRAQLSATLIGIFSQRLVPRISGGLIPAYELLIANSAVRNLIREGKTHEIPMVIDTSSQEGMVSLNRSLVELVKRGDVSLEHAVNYSLKPDEFKLLLR